MPENTVISRHPAFLLAVSLSFGVLFGGWMLKNDYSLIYLKKWNIIFIIIISSFVVVLVFKSIFSVNKPVVLAFFLGTILILIQGLGIQNICRIAEKMDHHLYNTKAMVRSYHDSKNGRTMDYVINDSDCALYGCRIYVFYSGNRFDLEELPEIGDNIMLSCRLEVPDGSSNPNMFDYREYLMGKKVYLMGYEAKTVYINDHTPFYIDVKRRIIEERDEFLRGFSNDAGASLAKGILFGDKSDITDEINDDFRNTGTAHILAVSGLHLGIIYTSYSLIRKRLKRIWAIYLVEIAFPVFLIMYGVATLWAPSVIRAIFLIFIKIISEKTNRRYDMLNSVGIINICILINSPFMIYNAGFQLSFLAAYGISIIIPRLRGKLPDFLLMPIGIQGFLLVYIVNLYNSFSLLSVPANIILVYLAGLYVPLGVLMFYGGIVFPHIFQTRIFERLLSSLGNMMIKTIDIIEGDGKMNILVTSPHFPIMVFVIMMALLLASETMIILIERKNYRGIKRLTVLIISLSILCGALSYSPFDDAREVFIDVGQGDSLHISNGKAKDCLIDGGGRYGYDVGRNILMPYLLKGGVRNIDLAIITHDHLDHYKGIQELGENYPINESEKDLIAGDVVEIDSKTKIEVLWPCNDTPKIDDENYYSRVFMVEINGIKTLVTGDITEEGERMLVEKYGGSGKLRCHILKVAHHGSKYSSSIDFLNECKPMVAVISVGKWNNYGHPSREVIEKMNDLGIIVYRTDLDGAVGIIPMENIRKKGFTTGFSVCTMKTRKLDNYSL